MGFEPTKHNAADFVSENNELLLGKMFVIAAVAVADDVAVAVAIDITVNC